MEVLYKLPLILEPQPEGGYTVTCPTVPELITEDDTVKVALANASDALTAIIEAYADLGQVLPEALRRSAPDELIGMAVSCAWTTPCQVRDQFAAVPRSPLTRAPTEG